MKRISVQLRQTIISTSVVGACFGAAAVLGLLLVVPGSHARLIAQGIAPPHWALMALQLAGLFLILVVGSIVVFGLLPAIIGRLIGRLAGQFRTRYDRVPL